MSKINRVICIILMLIMHYLGVAQNTKGLYVDSFYTIIQDQVLQKKLLEKAKKTGVNYLVFYDISEVHDKLFHLDDSLESLPLAKFISLAKNTYGIKNIGFEAEIAKTFIPIVKYNNFYKSKPTRKIDYINIEFEFWNRHPTGDTGIYCEKYFRTDSLPCTKETAFQFYQQQLIKADSIAHHNGLKLETYIGNVDSAQCAFIGQYVDRVLVHHYRQNDTYNDGRSLYQFKNERYQYLVSSGRKISVMPIFAATDEFMGPWLASHQEQQVFDTFVNGIEGYKQDTGTWKSLLKLDGYVWYNFSSFNKNYLDMVTALVEQNAFGYELKGEHLKLDSETVCMLYDGLGNELNQHDVTGTNPRVIQLHSNQLYFIRLISGTKHHVVKYFVQSE